MNTVDLAIRNGAGFWRLAAWMLVAVLTALTVGPSHLLPESPIPEDLEHLAAFAGLGAIFALAYRGAVRRTALWGTGALALLELAQVPMPGRHALLGDFLLNAGGFLIGLAGASAALRMLIRPGPAR